MDKPKPEDSIKIKATSSKRYGKCYEGKFTKVNVCGKKVVDIGGDDLPCKGNYDHCKSFDEGVCVQIIKFTPTRYYVLD